MQNDKEQVNKAKILTVSVGSPLLTRFFEAGKTTSILQLAKILIKLYNLEISPKFSNPLEGDVKNSQANIVKSQELLNWKYNIELEEGLKKMISNSP